MQKPSLKKVITILFIIILLIAGYFILLEKPQTAEADWWDDSWLYRQTVNITNSGTNQTDFQVMITLDSATLITANKIQSDCDDIRITDINGKLIPHWIEPSTCNTSATKIWTKVPLITTNGATLYLYYGNSAITSTSSTADTFIREISGVQGAWDMDEASWTNDCSTDTALDSSGNNNYGKSCPNADGTQPSAGKFGNGGVFDGTDDYVDITTIDISSGNPWSAELWFNPNVIGWQELLSNVSGYYELSLRVGGKFMYRESGSNEFKEFTMPVSPTVGNWYHVVFVANAPGYENKVNVYGNGQESTTGWSEIPDGGGTRLLIKHFGGTVGRFFNGSIDDVRIYNQALTATEISDLYGTGGDRQGYVTSNYPNKSLVRKYSALVSIDPPTGEERGPGPVAYWKFDEGFGQTANDSTINANNGTLGATSGAESSDPTWQTEDMCVTGKCLKFDGVDDYVDAGNDASLNITEAITVGAWVKSLNPGNYDQVIAKANASGSIDVQGYRLYKSGDNLFFNLGNGVGTGKLVSIGNIFDGNWHYVVGTWDGTTMRTYLNGNYIGQTTYSGIPTNAVNLNIGRGSDGSNRFNGSIDSVKIYPYARTAAQIKADYASRGTASGVSAVILSDSEGSRLSDGLVGYWKMDEASWDGTADEVVDASGAGNDGVAVGAGGIPTTGVGKFGSGGVFDGVDDYVNVPSLLTSNFTISFWAKTASSSSQDPIDTGFTSHVFARSYINANSKKIQFYGFYGGTISVVSSSAGTFPLNTWTHVIFQNDNYTQRIYLNGVLDGEEVHTGNTGTSGMLYIGGQSSWWNGSIDEVRIYNRALSPGEVRDLYNWAPGPVAHWKMDENVSGDAQTLNDISGNENAGTTVDGANDTGMDCSVLGKYGSGCEFDGVDDYVNCGNDASLDITDAITIEAWVKFGSVTKSQDIVAKRTAWNTPSGYRLAFDYTTVNGIEVRGRHYNYARANNAGLIVGEWYHIVGLLTETGSGNKIYINGVNKTVATSATENLASNSLDVIIGSNSPSSTGFFDGTIDDVRIYNYARTQAQILEDYAGGAGRKKQPIAHWKFDEGYGTIANNLGIGGTALNGTLTNMASPATSTSGWTDSGKIGKGLMFDGSDDYVDVGNDSSLDITEAITLNAWVKPNLLSGDQTIVDKYFWGTYGLLMGYGVDDGIITYRMNIGASDEIVNSLLAVNVGQWSMITATYNGSNMSIFINGVLSNSTSVSGVIGTNTNVVYIGRHNDDSWPFYFNGSIDDVKIYNYALTEDEVREEYNGGAFLKLGSTGTDSSGNPDDSQNREYCIPGDTSTCNPPVGRWDFSEGTGTTVNDTSTNNNTGTWNGTGEHWDLGKVGFGGSFNGSDDYVDCGNDNSLDITDAITIEAWVKNNGPGEVYDEIMSKNYSHNFSFLIESSNLLKFNMYVGGVRQTSTDIPYSSYYGNWSHLAGTYIASTGAMKVYINGILKTDETKAIGTFDTGGTFIIGSLSPSIKFFNGSIDQVRIYDYARTPAQVAWDYNRGKPVAHWRFNECQGSTANDASGNGNNGTITIGATGTQDGIGTCTDGDSSNAWYNGRTGKYNSAMSFDGTDDYVDVGSNDNLTPTNITISSWVKADVLDLWNGIVSNMSSWGTGFSLQIGTEKNIAAMVSGDYLKTDWIPITGRWYHISATHDSITDLNILYVDGIEENRFIRGISYEENPDTYIGVFYTSPNHFFNGLIDEVKIYNYALTAEQIKNEYNQGAVRFQ